MRLPFWEVSLFSQEPGQPAMIGSIVCFGDSATTMRKYVHEKRAQCSAILLRTKISNGDDAQQSVATKHRRAGQRFFDVPDLPKFGTAEILARLQSK